MWRRFFSKPDRNAELEEELEAHLAIETRQLMDRGWPRGDAEKEARRMFGSRVRVMETTCEVRHYAGFGRVWQDLRYGARVLRRGPGFTAAAVMSLALGIGATTAVFSIADTVFLRPLPYADARQLAWVGVHNPSMNFEYVTAPDYVAWRRDNRAFAVLAAAQPTGSQTVVLGGAEPLEVHMARVSANFLDAFAVTPSAGRAFRPEEELENGPKAALLTYRFWREHFHGRPDIVGSAIALDAQPVTVVGILPESFVYPVDVKVDLLTTLYIPPGASHHDRTIMLFSVFGRVKPGITMAQARADLEQLYAASIADPSPVFRPEDRPVLQSLSEHRAGDVRRLLFILMGAAGCLLAIACANVANLLLARWSSRARELAVRAAVGAGRGRLAGQLLTEIALLIAGATVVGMFFAAAALRGFVHFAAGELPRLGEVSADLRVFGIALGISLATALIFGGFPALRAGRVDLHSVLQHTGRGRAGGGRGLTRRVLVLVEVALSVVLLSGAALLTETLWHMQNDNLGFRPEHILTVAIPLRGAGFRGPVRDSVAADVLALLNRIPGTEAAALTECTPVYTARTTIFSRSDRPLPEPFHRGDSIGYCKVGPEYLKAAKTRLAEGRFFTEEDFHHPGSLAVINETAARTYFPGESPLGKQILGGRAAPWKTVVGVIADTKNQGLNQPAAPAAFINDTAASFTPDLFLIVRSLAPEDAFGRALRDGLRADHPGLLTKMETLDQTIGQMTASPRFNTVLLSAFAAIAFLMAIVGVYGVLAFSVTERRAEIGIRMALGATPRGVLGLVMKEGAILVAAGLAAGVAGALLLTRYLGTLLYGVKATDPATYATVGSGLAVAALMASFLPARRAAVVDPAVTLRHD